MKYIDDEAVDDDAGVAFDLRGSQPDEVQPDTEDENAITDHEVEAPFDQFESRRDLEADISVGELTPRHAKAQVDRMNRSDCDDSNADEEDGFDLSVHIRNQKANRKEQQQNETQFIDRQKKRVSQAKANKRGKQRKSIVDESDEEDVRTSDDDLLASDPESEVELVFENETNKKNSQATSKKPKTKMQVIRSQLKNQQVKQQKKKQQYDQESDDVLPNSKISKSGASKGMASAKSTQQSKTKPVSKMHQSSTVEADEAVDPVSDSEVDGVQVPFDESFVVDSESDEESGAGSEGEEAGSQSLAKARKSGKKKTKASRTSVVPSSDKITQKVLEGLSDIVRPETKTEIFKRIHGNNSTNKFFGASDGDTSSDDSIEVLSDHDSQPDAKPSNSNNNKPKPIIVDTNSSKMKPAKSPKVKSDKSPKAPSNESSVSSTPSLSSSFKKAKVDSIKISGHDFIITHRGEELPKGFDITKPMRPKNGKAAVGRRHYTTVCRAADKVDVRKHSVVLLIHGGEPVVLDKALANKIEKQLVELNEMKIDLDEWKKHVIADNNIANADPKHYQLMTCAERFESIKLSVTIQKRKRNESANKNDTTEDEKEPAPKKAKPSKPSQSTQDSAKPTSNSTSSKTKSKAIDANDTDDLNEDAKAMYANISGMFDDKLNSCFLTALKAQTQIMVHSKDVKKAQDYMATLLGPISEFQAIKDVSSANQWTELQKQHPQEGKLEELLKFFIIFNPKAKQYMLSELKFLCKSTM